MSHGERLEVGDIWQRPSILIAIFGFFSAQAIPFEFLYLATSFLVWWYIFRISRSQFCFKVMGPRSRSWLQKAVACNEKNRSQTLLELDGNICYDNARSNCSSSKFECLKLAASVSVWRYIFRIFRTLSSFKVNLMVAVAKQWQHAGLYSPQTQFNLVMKLLCYWLFVVAAEIDCNHAVGCLSALIKYLDVSVELLLWLC